MKKQFFSFLVALIGLVTMSTTAVANPRSSTPSPAVQSAAPAQIANPFQDIPVVVNGVTVGAIDVTQFIVRQGKLLARATFTSVSGATEALLIPVQNISGTCTILDLDLGPIRIDLLGLVIDLSAIHLDITGQTGNGRLLGNLLCAVASLLDNGPTNALTQIAGLLNQILGAL